MSDHPTKHDPVSPELQADESRVGSHQQEEKHE